MAIYTQNLHTHGPLCDGKTDYEDMVKRAIGLGFDSIGFSGHAYTDFDITPCMTPDDSIKYRKTIADLKTKYENVIDIFCGVEFDIYSQDDLSVYDYVIGSAHYIKKNGEYLIVDPSCAEYTKNLINEHFDGDGLKYAKAYYEEVSKISQMPRCDIVGHFDLVTKNVESGKFLDTSSPTYRKYALEALHAVLEKCNIFEINVGGIARGYRLSPYPEDFLLKEIKAMGGNVVISSDCHHKRYLNDNFDIGLALAKNCGFDKVLYLTKDGFKEKKI